MKLAIIGTRTFNDYELMVKSLSDLPGVELVISGEAPGADQLAKRWAEERGIEYVGLVQSPATDEMLIKICTHVAVFSDSSGLIKVIERLAKKHKRRYRIVKF